VSNRVSRRQEGRWAQQEQQQWEQQQQAPPPPPPAAAPTEAVDPIAKLKELAELHDSGVLTDEEFSSAKAKLLASG
jgi:hypothetical protein